MGGRSANEGEATCLGAIAHPQAGGVDTDGRVATSRRWVDGHWRILGAAEGTDDEVELITELQWHPGGPVFVKINNGFGLTEAATDWAPEVGVVFSF